MSTKHVSWRNKKNVKIFCQRKTLSGPLPNDSISICKQLISRSHHTFVQADISLQGLHM